MAEDKSMRLSQVAKILNQGISSVVSRLSAKGFKVDSNPNSKVNSEQLGVLADEFKSADLLGGASVRKPTDMPAAVAEPSQSREDDFLPTYSRNDVSRPAPKPAVAPVEARKAEDTPEDRPKTGLPGLKVLGTIDDYRPKPAAVSPAPTPIPAQPVVSPPVQAQPVSVKPEAKVAPVAPAVPVETAPVTPQAAPTKTPETVKVPEAVKPPEAVKVPAAAPVVAQPAAIAQPAPVAPVPPVVEAIKVEKVEPSRAEPAKEVPRPIEPTAVTPIAVPPTAPPVEAKESQPTAKPTPQEPTPANVPNTRPVERKPNTTSTTQPRPDARPNAAKGQRDNGGNRPANPVNATPPAETTKPVAPVPTEGDEPQTTTETIRAAGSHQLPGLKVLGTIDLSSQTRSSGGGNAADRDRKKRKRIRGRDGGPTGQHTNAPGSRPSQPGTNAAGQPNAQGTTNAPRPPRENREGGNRAAGDRGPRPEGNRPANAPAGANTAGAGNANRPAPANSTGSGTAGNTNRPANANRGRNTNDSRGGDRNKSRERRDAPTASDVNASIRATQARMTGNTRPTRGVKAKSDRRDTRRQREGERLLAEQEEAKILKVTEFVSANDLASFMDVSVNEVISVCMNLGMFVSINQRLDAEAITVIADEFGFDVQFVSAEEEVDASVIIEDDDADTLIDRAPIVTIMGHVDHGKTSLLDYIRRTRVAAGEAGGITQHIGAYSVKTDDGRPVTFLDTPGHEAFTAMRARGAKVTDVVIIVIAADDSVMPQTREAINHAQVAGVPIVFAFSKVDKPGADTEKIRNELSQMNLLVEEWGGKYQTQEISSKSGLGIPELLEKVLLEAELLELKANPERRAIGTVVEASLDKGRGYVSTVLVQTGTLRVGDIVLVGAHYGRIRAMTDALGKRLKEAGPSTPVQILGLPGAPQAGDKFNVMETEREAREIANKREQLLREQTLRTRKHITLEEIGRRKAIGTFKELNAIVKGDVDGSVEALSDSLLQLSTDEVQVNIIHKAVGQISESDILLASASDAIIIGFQVRPSVNARKLAEQEQIEIRMYSIIYDAINEVKDAMTGMLAPTVEEVVTGNIEVREVFKISKIGTVAGCYVTDGIIKRNNKIRVIRDFIVIHTGEISALKRFKDDVSEVRSSYECGLSIKNFNDIEVGDVIEGFEFKEVKRTL